ncbi:PilW family protein [Pelotomaculum propionicicum]|uniref:Prepilin-type N-terminal cleavage/methylation domain-containing protein n=1 Tax=Pelotomaculum propionicicum TaxID=258475 RepID=A0A4Y7RLM8_9FIRM|nr:hypothetical protein [Pelotomaculum propionicicum]NLI11363.1 hypothetical protein [Peptococcaceae bacterium]TEB09582.1 hypothetical protein Pmgp_03013 [Pelotomaculum propionicicum]
MKSDQRGITLLETSIALSIMSFAVLLFYVLYVAGVQSVQKEEKRFGVQQNTRNAAGIISSEVRHATSIGTSIPSGSVYYTIRLDNDSNCLVIDTYNNGNTTSRIVGKYITGLSFSNTSISGKPGLSFTVSGNNGSFTNDYLISSQVLLLNISSLSSFEDSTIYFTR